MKPPSTGTIRLTLRTTIQILNCPLWRQRHIRKRQSDLRNREMAERADLIICYIEHQSGGAYQAVQYAEKLGKTVINLAEEVDF